MADGHKGAISFTEEERKAHLETLPVLLKTGASCLEADLARHQSFYRAHGFSPFYGDRSTFGKLPHRGKLAFLRNMGVNPKLIDQMEPTSCVGLLLKCMGKGFEAAKQENLWKRLRAYTLLNGADGTSLQAGLQKLGWKLLYWNPDVRRNSEWDRKDHARDPSNKFRYWGYHEYNWQLVQKKSTYLYNHVDDDRTLVNFGEKAPQALANVPFWVGTAHGGYHVFPGTGIRVVEAHSTRKLTDAKTLQADPFNPLNGDAPTDGDFYSGLVAVPPR